MPKKRINQNTIYDEEFINSIEPDFTFANKPINRFKIIQDQSELNSINKNKLLTELKKQINSIEDCNLKSHSEKLILGDGNLNSPIMIIGEAPGVEESKTGLTFQGDVGRLLNKMLSAINIEKKNTYLSYAINFQPPEDRKPTSQEIKRYSIFLKKHISIIDPKILILMGSTAMESIIGFNEKISSERGKWKEIIINNKTYPIIITFNPSYLIRFPENKKYSWEDLKKIKQKIQDLNLKPQ